MSKSKDVYVTNTGPTTNNKEDMNFLPDALVEILSKVEVTDANHALVIYLHVLMLETGFVISSDGSCDDYVSLYQKNDGIYKFEYHHKNFPSVALQMTCVPLANLLSVHGTIPQKPLGTSMVLNVNHFVTKNQSLSGGMPVYCNLRDLSVCFKDEFALAVLTDIHHYLEIEPQFGFVGLPVELKFYIMSGLPVESLVSLSSANKEFNEISKSMLLWKSLFHRDFPNALPLSEKEHHKWKELYMKEYIKKQEQAKLLNRTRDRESCRWRSMIDPPHWFPLPYRRPSYVPFDFESGVGSDPLHAFPRIYGSFLDEDPILHDIFRNRSRYYFRL